MHKMGWTIRFAILLALLAPATLAPVSGTLAQGGPQPLPSAACNEGTGTAHTAIPHAESPAHDRIAHEHTFDGATGCFHFNPSAEPAS